MLQCEELIGTKEWAQLVKDHQQVLELNTMFPIKQQLQQHSEDGHERKLWLPVFCPWFSMMSIEDLQ